MMMDLRVSTLMRQITLKDVFSVNSTQVFVRLMRASLLISAMRAFTVSCKGGDVRVDELGDVEAAFRTLHEACFQENTVTARGD